MSQARPLSPVKPAGMEIIYYYPCPDCGRKVPLIAPLQPSMARCDACRSQFPVVPADQRSIRFIKTMLDEGKAGIDPDFI
jgi:DNA-directed RNA polymerase subunit RPC12/RpoP